MCLENVYSTASAMACKVCDANQSSFMTNDAVNGIDVLNVDIAS
jgi:hypothetical protein